LPEREVRKDTTRVQSKRKYGREVKDSLFIGKGHLTVRRFPFNARSSF
jgi:hypothetical protein